MGPTKIDQLIEELEKAEIRTQLRKADDSGPASLPTVEDGKIGIWRNVRGRRVFLELEGPELAGVTADILARMSGPQKKARFGRYFDEEGTVKPQFRTRLKQTKVLKGPGDLAGHDIGKVPSESWGKLTRQNLESEFGKFEGDSKRLESLRRTVKESGAELDDEGKEALGSNNPIEVANVAINTGMSVDEVKEALGGKVSQIGDSKTTSKPFNQEEDASDNVVPFERPKRLKTKFKPKEDGERPSAPATPEKPSTKPDTSDDSGTSNFDGNLALALDPASADSTKDAFDEILERIEDATKDGPLKRLVKQTRKDLRDGKITPKQAQSTIYDAAVKRLQARQAIGADNGDVEHEAQRRADTEEEAKDKRLPAPPVNKEDVQNDRNAVQDAIKDLQNLEDLIQQHLEEAKGDRKKAQEAAMKQILDALNTKVKSPRVRMEVQRLQRAKGGSTRSTMIALIQILRLILTLLIPG